MKKLTLRLGIYAVLISSLFLSGCGMQSIPTALNEVEAAWSEVLNQYKRRSDLIPNLVNIVKGSAAHEKETLTAIVEARAKATQTQVSALCDDICIIANGQVAIDDSIAGIRERTGCEDIEDAFVKAIYMVEPE